MQIKKQDIYSLPLNEIAETPLEMVADWCEHNKLSYFHTWLPAQLLAHFGTWKLQRDPGGKPLVMETLKHNVTSPWHRGAWKLTRIKRSLLVPKQIAQAEYGAFTPLILAGFKKMQGIRYESWRGCEHLELVLEPELLDAVQHDSYDFCSLGSDRLLELRQQGLVTQSGAAKGKLKSAESTWALSGMQGTELDGLPKWTQTMLCQCWLAHPKNRSPYMILDPQNWDNMPEPLISAELFTPQKSVAERKQKQTAVDLPF